MSDRIRPAILLRTKLNRPPLPDAHVVRPLLLSKLNSARNHPLTLVTAPAGYGKTTLLNAWIDQGQMPAAWLSLDEGDNDLALFLGYVVASLRTVIPGFGQGLMKYTQVATLPPLPVITAFLCNEIDQIGQDFVLALDDYQLITNPDIHSLLNNVLKHPPHHMHLVILARREPPLRLATLRAYDQVVDLGPRDLRFSSNEVVDFVRQTLDEAPSQSIIASLAEATEGWPAGVRLTTIFLGNLRRINVEPNTLRVDNNLVVDYLVEEVLSRQSPALRQFLFQISILERFSAPLCAAVTGAVDSAAAHAG